MADNETFRELLPSLISQKEYITGESECLGCIELVNNLKSAVDEISSLKLIIQLLMEDGKSESDTKCDESNLTTVREFGNNKKECGVSTSDLWTTVTTKQNTRKCKDIIPFNSKQHTITSNRYIYLDNLPDPIRNTSMLEGTTRQETPGVKKGVLLQTESTNQEVKASYIPSIVNGVISSNAIEGLVKTGLNSNKDQLDGTTTNNKLTIKNRWKQSRVVILSDSQLTGCTKMITNSLGDSFSILGWMKPGAMAEEVWSGMTRT